MSRCDPCKSGSHDECNHSLKEPCDCIVCIAGAIGERVVNDRDGGRQLRKRSGPSWPGAQPGRDPEFPDEPK